MYVCVCRGITSNQVNEAVYKGARCVRDVNVCIGTPVQCGKCCRFMKKMVNEAVATLSSQSE